MKPFSLVFCTMQQSLVFKRVIQDLLNNSQTQNHDAAESPLQPGLAMHCVTASTHICLPQYKLTLRNSLLNSSQTIVNTPKYALLYISAGFPNQSHHILVVISYKHLNVNAIIGPSQHGFIRVKSCLTNFRTCLTKKFFLLQGYPLTWSREACCGDTFGFQ